MWAPEAPTIALKSPGLRNEIEIENSITFDRDV
jgi:hypothetical protein